MDKEKIEKEIRDVIKAYMSKFKLDYIEVSATPSCVAVRINEK